MIVQQNSYQYPNQNKPEPKKYLPQNAQKHKGLT